jgi:adenylate cyclase
MILRALIVGVGAAVLTVALVVFGPLDGAEYAVYDRLFVLRGARPATAPIVIVTIDEDSFDELNLQWPFPRALHGQLLWKLAEAQPLAIGLDILFPEPSSRGAADDETLGAAVTVAGNVVLGAASTMVSEGFYTKVDLNPPLPVIREGAAAWGPVNHTLGADGVLRHAVVEHKVEPQTWPGWDTALYNLAKASGYPVAPLPSRNEILINYRGGPKTYPWVPYHRVVQGEVPPEVFKGKIVLIGATSPTLQDIFSTPFALARGMPGVEVHANVLDTLLNGDAMREIPRWVTTVVAVLVALGAPWLVVRLRAFRAFLVVFGGLVVLLAATYAAFTFFGVWSRSVSIALALGLGYGVTVIDNFIREQREKRRLSQFFSPKILREVVRQRDGASLNSSRRLITVLFSDVRGFTSISERTEPEVVVQMLREYLTELTEVVFQNGGTVDKYIGDCIMALYNVPFEDPEHAVNAIKTGLEFQERTLAVSARWEAKLGAAVRNGVGINTGEAVVGTMGSVQRLEYTAIGDTVNLAARLESITKEYNTSIIISEYTYEAVKGKFLTRQLGAVSVKGKTRPVRIYAVLPDSLRKHPRSALDAGATLFAVDGTQRCAVRTRDISTGGLALEGVPPDWTPGTIIQIRCEGGLLPKPIIAEGKIMWRTDELVGVQFISVDPDSEQAIEHYVATQGPLPEPEVVWKSGKSAVGATTENGGNGKGGVRTP